MLSVSEASPRTAYKTLRCTQGDKFFCPML